MAYTLYVAKKMERADAAVARYEALANNGTDAAAAKKAKVAAKAAKVRRDKRLVKVMADERAVLTKAENRIAMYEHLIAMWKGVFGDHALRQVRNAKVALARARKRLTLLQTLTGIVKVSKREMLMLMDAEEDDDAVSLMDEEATTEEEEDEEEEEEEEEA